MFLTCNSVFTILCDILLVVLKLFKFSTLRLEIDRGMFRNKIPDVLYQWLETWFEYNLIYRLDRDDPIEQIPRVLTAQASTRIPLATESNQLARNVLTSAR